MDFQNLDQQTLILIAAGVILVLFIVSLAIRKSKEQHIKTDVTKLQD